MNVSFDYLTVHYKVVPYVASCAQLRSYDHYFVAYISLGNMIYGNLEHGSLSVQSVLNNIVAVREVIQMMSRQQKHFRMSTETCNDAKSLFSSGNTIRKAKIIVMNKRSPAYN